MKTALVWKNFGLMKKNKMKIKHTLSSKRVYKAAEVFEQLSERYPYGKIKMLTVGKALEIGTPCSPYVWFGYWLREKELWKPEIPEKLNTEAKVAYQVEAQNMFARFIGFDDKEQLRSYMVENVNIWGVGSRYPNLAYRMFGHESAYGKELNMLTLKHVAKHWRKVAERLEATEELSRMSKEVSK